MKFSTCDSTIAKTPFAAFLALTTQYAALKLDKELPESLQPIPVTEKEIAITPDPPEVVIEIAGYQKYFLK